MKVMKTKIFPLVLLILCTLSCRRPAFPKPGEPTMLEISDNVKSNPNLPWRVVKGARIASSLHVHDVFFVKKGFLKKFANRKYF